MITTSATSKNWGKKKPLRGREQAAFLFAGYV